MDRKMLNMDKKMLNMNRKMLNDRKIPNRIKRYQI